MNRSKDMLGMVAVCVLSLGAVLAGCAQHDQTTAADSAAALASRNAIVDRASGASDKASAPGAAASAARGDLPVVVITGHREGWRSLVLSERNPGSHRD